MGTKTMTDKVKGKTNEMVGAARRKAGDMTGNESMEAKGAAQEMKGKGQGMVGEAKDKADDLKDKVTRN
jgi:uncharacterized protein YjbJ (UPF0337 family)